MPFHVVETKTFLAVDEFYSNYKAVDGTVGPLGYYAYYDHRQREGFRETNSDYQVDAGSAQMVWDVTSNSRFILTFDAYEEEHGEPGGLRRRAIHLDPDPALGGALSRTIAMPPRASSIASVCRAITACWITRNCSRSTRSWMLKAFGGYLSRWSKRQRGGDIGIQPDPAESGPAGSNDIQDRFDWTEGAEARLRHDYNFFGDVSTFAGGLYFYHALQHRDDRRGSTPDAEDGLLRRSNFGETYNGSIFAENRFHFDRLSITPGMRLEFFQQSLDEEFNFTKTDVPLGLQVDDFSFVPLFGVGASYVLVAGEAMVSFDDGRRCRGKDAKAIRDENCAGPMVEHRGPPRPKFTTVTSRKHTGLASYGELVLTGPSSMVNGDLEEGHSLHYELGLRGKPLPYLNFDISGFLGTILKIKSAKSRSALLLDSPSF